MMWRLFAVVLLCVLLALPSQSAKTRSIMSGTSHNNVRKIKGGRMRRGKHLAHEEPSGEEPSGEEGAEVSGEETGESAGDAGAGSKAGADPATAEALGETDPSNVKLPDVKSAKAPQAIGPGKDIDTRLREAQTLLQNLNEKITEDTNTAKQWHEVIKNYQFKYSSLRQSIQDNTKKYDDLNKLLKSLENAKMHNDMETELKKFQENLGTLASAEGGDAYKGLSGKIQEIKKGLNEMNDKVQKVVAEVPEQFDQAIRGDIPPASSDALDSMEQAETDGDKKEGGDKK